MYRPMLRSKDKWVINQVDEKKVQALTEALPVSPLTARLLVLRGLDQPEQADLFLHPEQLAFHDPMLMRGMHAASERISQAVAAGQKIRIFGDYDADGVTATALLYRVLVKLGANVSYYIPNRFRDGYGPNKGAVEAAQKEGIGLIITVDSGIAAMEAAECAAALGIDYIVTDHHEPPALLPQALTILNPKQPGCTYPFKGLSGAGVALKLAQALVPDDAFDARWIALAAIGTIADLVPLRDENRLIACRGLQLISGGSFAGIDTLKKRTGRSGTVDSDMIGFQMAPRLNAAGRLEDAESAIRLLLTNNLSEASACAERLERLNQQRKMLTDNIFREADRMAAVCAERGDKALVLAGHGWNQGVVGLAASKIVEKYYRPAILLAIDTKTGIAKGSARSIEGFNLYRALTDSSAHLEQFGGHQMAAGLSLKEEEIDAFRADFLLVTADRISEEMLIRESVIDGICSPDQITVEQIEQIHSLAPFGTNNPSPLFLMDRVNLTKINSVGRDAAHLKVTIKGNEKELDGIGFGFGKVKERLSPADRPSMIGKWEINEWNGFRRPQFLIEDIRVDGLQIFDWRSERDLSGKITALEQEQVTVLAFRPESPDHLNVAADILLFHQDMIIQRPVLILLDLPERQAQLAELLRNSPVVERIYAVFHHQHDHYFSAFPARKDFAWYYALIRRERTFRLDAMVRQIARFKGWTDRMVYFMTKVFFELGFVKIDNGVLTLNPEPEKAPLTDSATYRKEKNQIEVEDLFCYSPISSLKSWFEDKMKNQHQAVEPEGTMNGL